ncbi:beta-glucosidase 12-like isoform X2 [Dioscorea cayenensis subsp. rotundata]|uniref:Beta-glucosidase 12-like isoform X2 n=1 Tax=Dioscorea cayennensis subsp. rotundata TaxID=55577 RepID=A0AB40BAF7_DIOCR|nr:beta-glucosidase 12-like isoform X2 [Dioscorea cayenensis subsp. rotundata]
MALITIPSSSFYFTTASKQEFSFINNGKRLSLVGIQRRTCSPLVCKKSSNNGDSKKSKVEPQVLLGRKSFPSGFTFGASSSAYQVEGGASEGGRGPCIWDTFALQHPEKIQDRSSGSVACDSFRKYEEDVKLLKDAGMDAYRFSISWSRILPKGSIKGGINHEGIAYYNNLINELIQNGIKPFVTIFHWDVPQALEDEYGGFLNRRILDDFKDYCEVCFREFGDRVKHWITLNEPWTFSSYGYDTGVFAPGRSSISGNCSLGDSAREPYIVSHNLILAHALAVKLYREKFQDTQKGEVGITLVSHWMTPITNSVQNEQTAERALKFMFGWYMDPLVHGDYPFIMKALVRERLPCFTEEESEMIKGSYDFIGINYYTARYAYSLPLSSNDRPISYNADSYVDLRVSKLDGGLIGEPSGSNWLFVYPDGIRDLLLYTKNKYNDPVIYITENGTSELDSETLSLQEALDDKKRVNYYALHLSKVEEAIRLGVNVKGYFAWSLMDNYEWADGYTMRFGLTYIDYKDGSKRYPKASLQWFTKFLKS